MEDDITCRKCGHHGPATLSQSGPHVRADCSECGRYIKFVSQPGSRKWPKTEPGSWEYRHPARVRMRELPPTEKQLEVIRNHGGIWEYIEPEDRDEASRIIEMFVTGAWS